jgi:uncharacterized protein YtpQ (UPF0354 family)
MPRRATSIRSYLSAMLTSTALLLTAGLSMACAREQTDADRAKALQQEAIEVLRQRFPQHSFTPSDDGTTVVRDDDTQFGLVNLRARLDDAAPQTAEARRAAIAKFFDEALAVISSDIPKTWADVKPLIRVSLITAGHDHARTSITRPFAADIVLAFVVDQPTAMRYITEELRQEWKCSIDELQAAAFANLDALSADDQLQVSEKKRADGGADRLLLFGTDDGYAAARLASPAFRKRLTEALGDSFVAGIPNRDVLFAWTKDLPDHARLAKQIKDDARKYPYPISSTLLVVTNGDVKPLERP